MRDEVIASILEANGFPSGRHELVPGAALAAIHIEGKNGPAPVPNYAMVQVFGCRRLLGSTRTVCPPIWT